mgnify:FL=1
MLKHGLNSLLDPQSEEEDLDIEALIGSSDDGKWVIEKAVELNGDETTSSSQQPENIYQFEG